MDRPEAPQRLRLGSWKEIAVYLRREVRTVQLWEKKEGLPARRHGHTARATVYAYTDELDAWLAARQSENTTRPNKPVANGEGSGPKRWGRVFLLAGLACLLVAALVMVTGAYRRRARANASPRTRT